jgi:hypothetical protein
MCGSNVVTLKSELEVQARADGVSNLIQRFWGTSLLQRLPPRN